jgi:hypothetical protein
MVSCVHKKYNTFAKIQMKNCLIKKNFQYQQVHSSTIMYFT